MKIAVSLLNFRPGLMGGIETYVRQLVGRLPALAGSDQIVLVVYRDIAGAILTPGLGQVVVEASDRQVVAWRILEAFTPFRARAVERVFEALAPDVIFFPQQSLFPKRVSPSCVLTVVDIQHYFYPHYFSLFDRAFRAAMYPYSLRRADRVIAISEYTRRTVIQHCRLAPEKIVAIPLGVARRDTSAIVPTDRFPRPYLYYPAATFPHKNHATLFRTFAALRKGGDFPYKLVLTGKQTQHWQGLKRLIAELGIEQDVIHPGFVSFEEVGRIYKGAEAVVFPTQFEGFGLPVTEAVEFDRKVICSRLEVFDEIGVPRRFQIDFADPGQLRAALALEGPTKLEKPPCTWAQTAKATLDVCRRAVADGTTRK